MTQRIAVIQFPGSNCEYETAKSLQAFGMDAEIVRWTISESEFHAFDGYVLPGGFSFQDRVRAGVVSAKLGVVSFLEKANEEAKPILGICNGCQILAETGLVPDRANERRIEMALAPNTRDDDPHGFVCDWVFVKPTHAGKNIFLSQFSESDVIPIPINHGEGHFVLSGDVDDLASLRYCDSQGQVLDQYPVNPNGTTGNIAGLSNVQGNVFAMMPHPERATFMKQVPVSIESDWAERKRRGESGDGPWALMFKAMSDYIATKKGVYATS